MIDEVSRRFLKLFDHTLHVVVGLAAGEDLLDGMVSVLYEFALPHVEHVRETEYLQVVYLLHAQHLFAFEELIKENESALIV